VVHPDSTVTASIAKTVRFMNNSPGIADVNAGRT
jgi:hypothetical protein